jgi:membrane protein
VPAAAPSPGSRRLRLAAAWARFVHIYQKEIWASAFLKDRSLKGWAYAFLRVLSITITVFVETRVATRAAALGFSSLLGLGPLLAIATLVAGFALGQSDSKAIATRIDQMLQIVAPQLQAYEKQLTKEEEAYLFMGDAGSEPILTAAAPPAASAGPEHKEPPPRLVNIIGDIINASRSGKAGAVGAFSLLLIVLLLFKAIEDTFNDIWGVRQGRSVLTRIVFYWTILTLGALLFFAAVALLNASTFLSMFSEWLPNGADLVKALGVTLPLFSVLLLACVLTLFYRVIPNTRVFWSAAFVGALVVAALLSLNNFIAFLYVKRVTLERSLYGSLALPLVVMSGLYIFWLCVLTGGIVSYAVQNVHFRNSQAAWSTLTHATRERLALVVFFTICRRFRECLPPISASHLSEMLKVPTQLLNECLNRLVQLKLVTILRPDPGSTASDYLYQPARPLNRITLYDFKTLDDNFGEDPIGASLERIDPLLRHYDAAVAKMGEEEFFQKTMEQLFAEHPFDESRPPFAFGTRAGASKA